LPNVTGKPIPGHKLYIILTGRIAIAAATCRVLGMAMGKLIVWHPLIYGVLITLLDTISIIPARLGMRKLEAFT